MKLLYSTLVACLLTASLTAHAASPVVISEFLASNTRGLLDEDGNNSDWIEIRNVSGFPVNLNDWSLTDNSGSLTKWRFPATNINAGAYMIIFASGQDRRVPGRQLHTSFQLSASGEYLALVMPDGVTIATEFRQFLGQFFPTQVPNVSYGFGLVTSNLTLVSTTATLRVRIPANDSDGANWMLDGYNDSAWTAGTNGVGFGPTGTNVAADYSAAVLPTAPVLYYRCSETSGATAANAASSGAANNGTYTGGGTLGNAGPRPPAFNGFEADNRTAAFNGTSAYVAGPAQFLSGRSAFTMGGWVNFASAPAARAGLFGQNDAIEFGFNAVGSIQCFSAGGGSATLTYNPPLNTWVHILTVGNGSNIRIFTNGVLLGSGGSATANYGSSAFNFNIGGGGVFDATGNFHNGMIDEVVAYHRALSDAEILGLYQAGTNGAAVAASTFVRTDVGPTMSNLNASAHIRIPFLVDSPTNFSLFSLRMRYDDGFAAFINGIPVASANAPGSLAFNSAATTNHTPGVVEEFRFGVNTNVLVTGTNILAIQGLNRSATDDDFLILAELSGTTVVSESTNAIYFTQPTPGAENSGGVTTPGPVITEVGHTPNVPLDSEDVIVTARVAQSFANAFVTNVTLRYRIMFGTELPVQMFDDGLHGDGGTNDGVFGASIPASASTNGQMIRYVVRATDTQGSVSRWPLFLHDPAGSPEYLGTIVNPTNLTSKLPILHLFANTGVVGPGPTTTATGADSEGGGRISLFHDGEFYDNIGMSLRGNTTASYNKKSHRVEFNNEHRLRHPGASVRVRKTSFVAEYPDPSYIRQRLAMWLCNQIGSPAPFYYPVRLQLNGNFYQLANHNEVNGDDLAGHLGYDNEGAYYKAAGQVTPGFASTGGFEKLNPRDGLTADYVAFATAIGEAQNLAARRTNIFDQMDVPNVINYAVAARWMHENDDVWANMTLYRDTFGTKEWRIVPFDLNLSWGAIFAEGTPDLYTGIQSTNDNHKAHPLYGSSQALALSGPGGGFNRVYDAIFQVPQTREMYLRRMRTMLDAIVKPPGTPTNDLVLEPMILQWRDDLAEEALRDRTFWSWPTGPSGQNSFPSPPNAAALEFTNAVNGLLNEFIARRRSHFYVKHAITSATAAFPVGITKTNNGGIPLSQPAGLNISINAVEFNPANSNQLQEYICVTNPNPVAIDISGWALSGGVSFTFRPGTVMPSNSVLYLSPDVNAFRARTVTPRGGQGHFVQGPYQGQLSARGETLILADNFGRVVSSNSYAGNPSLAQQFLRITELMYNPSPLAGNTNDAQAFEYLELRNISDSATLNLNGVRFINGVEFNFTGSAITSLAPGARALVVRNTAAFTARYGGGLPVAGQYTNALDNAGERIQLVDNFGEEILDFSYNNSWYPITDGFGFSLVTADENAEPDLWDSKSNWRPSGVLNGGPGVADPAPPAFAPVVVNELMNNTDPPQRDTVELFNASTNDASIGGWFLSDDLRTPKKYRFPDGTMIAAGGYLLIDETTLTNAATALIPFAFSGNGDEAWLFSGDANTNLTGYLTGEDFGAAAADVSFGRYTNSQGKIHFVAQSTNTFGAANAGPRIGPVVIAEIHYHPPDLEGGLDNDQDEYIVLKNITASPVSLFHGTAPSNTWRLRGGVEYNFPASVTLGASESVILVNFPATNAALVAAFLARFPNLDDELILGPYGGKLNNDTDNLRLERPDDADVSGVPYILVDRVEYEDGDGWPEVADGGGASLQRLNNAAYGNDPINWAAAIPTAAGYVGGSAPVITSQPSNANGLVGQSVMFSVMTGGTAPFQYQWRREGAFIPDATNSILTLSNLKFEQAGAYSVLVYNRAGSAVSSNAVLNVLIPATILAQPASVEVRVRPDMQPDVAPATNASFTVSVASANPPISYQWLVNGTNITATNIFGMNTATLLVSNVVMDNFGAYSCQITDGNGTVFSAAATLYPLVRPLVWIGPPNPLIVPAGQPVPVSVVLSNGWPPPFGYQWRSNALAVATPVSNSKTNFFVIPAAFVPTNAINSTFRVIVTNRAVTTFQVAQSATFTLTTLLDTDRDGIPDTNEVALGLMPNNAADALLDLDGDSMSNLAEYQAGTNPNDTNSYLRVDITATNNLANLIVAAVSNRTYTVQYSDALPASWNKLADLIARATNRVEIVPDPDWTTNRFYRLALPAQ